MSSKKLLIELFSLPPEEIIFQDYGCAVKQILLKYGRIFLSENHYSFYANVGGNKTTIVIHIDKVQTIEKKGKSEIDVTLKDGKIYHFASFSDRDSVYKLMNALLTGQPASWTSEAPVGVDEKQAESTGDKISDAEVEVNFLTPDGKDTDQAVELMKVVLPVSVDKFFDFFIADEASLHSLVMHRASVGDTDTQITKWQEDQSGFQRELKSVIKLKDVPFKDRSRLHKIQSYKRTGNSIVLSSTTNTLDVPYANYFQAEERWEINEQEGDANKCVLRCFGWVVFLKSTMMKKTITSRSQQGFKEDYEIWVNNVKRKLEASVSKQQSQGSSQANHEYEEYNISIMARSGIKNQRRTSSKEDGLANTKHQSELLNLVTQQVRNPKRQVQIGLGFIILLLLIIIGQLSSISSRLSALETSGNPLKVEL